MLSSLSVSNVGWPGIDIARRVRPVRLRAQLFRRRRSRSGPARRAEHDPAPAIPTRDVRDRDGERAFDGQGYGPGCIEGGHQLSGEVSWIVAGTPPSACSASSNTNAKHNSSDQ